MLSEKDREKEILYDVTFMWKQKQLKKGMHTTKTKQTHRYREQTSFYQWGEGRKEGQDRGRELRGT